MMSEITDAGVDEILSEVQADDYYAIVPEWVLFHADLSHGAVRLYGVLRRFADQRGIAFPGLSAIGEKYGVVPRSVTRHMDELITAGAITRKRRLGTAGRATSNLYRVHSRPTFLHVKDDFNPDTTAATTAATKARTALPDDQRTKMSDGARTKMSDGPTDKNVRLTTATLNHNQEDPQSSGALRAPTADPVETSSSSNQFRNAGAGEGAAAANGDLDEHGDAPRAGQAPRNPEGILSAMMLNPDEASRFRVWLVQATGAVNPDGLVVSLQATGRLSERLSQWRASETAPDPSSAPHSPVVSRPGHLEWCGRCEPSTRTIDDTDEHGREYIRRCPACNINAGLMAPGAGASQAIAQQAAIVAANRTTATTGRDAVLAARAALAQGAPQRTTTIGTLIPTQDVLRAQTGVDQ